MKKRISIMSTLLAVSLTACGPAPTEPTPSPSATVAPTAAPTAAPPTSQPTTAPTNAPVVTPTLAPTSAPTTVPTSTPTTAPTATATPATTPTPATSPTANGSVPAPLNLRTTARTGTNLSVSWTFPSLDVPSTYNVYLDGQQVASGLTRNFYTYSGLASSTSFDLAVETVTANGISNRTTLRASTAASTFSGGSGGSGGGGGGGGNGGANPSPTPTPVPFQQVERLARPAINEGLIRQDTPTRAQLLKTWNSVPPSVDLADIPAAAEIRTEAVTVLDAIQGQVQAVLNPNDDPATANPVPPRTMQERIDRRNEIVAAFLPDMLRIDTTGPSGYAAGITDLTNPRPFRGRRIDEDVIDITLQVLVPGGALDPLQPNGAQNAPIARVETDNVEYNDTFDGARIHDAIPGTFPYLPEPHQ